MPPDKPFSRLMGGPLIHLAAATVRDPRGLRQRLHFSGGADDMKYRKNPGVVTDFEFPPRVTGTWRTLSRAQREQWLIAACNRHFKRLNRRGSWNDARPGTVFVIDGSAIQDHPAFLCALGEAINGPGGYFGGLNALSLQDCLYGAFEVTLPFVLRIESASTCRAHLDGAALAACARERLDSGDYLDEEGKQWLLDTVREGERGARSLFDELVEELRFHGVTVEER